MIMKRTSKGYLVESRTGHWLMLTWLCWTHVPLATFLWMQRLYSRKKTLSVFSLTMLTEFNVICSTFPGSPTTLRSLWVSMTEIQNIWEGMTLHPHSVVSNLYSGSARVFWWQFPATCLYLWGWQKVVQGLSSKSFIIMVKVLHLSQDWCWSKYLETLSQSWKIAYLGRKRLFPSFQSKDGV